MYKVDVTKLKPLAYPTEDYKVRNAFKLGREHARNFFNDEEADPDWAIGTTWAHCPYTECRPSVFHSWIGGFCEQYAELIKKC